jgi:hypothetical protein
MRHLSASRFAAARAAPLLPPRHLSPAPAQRLTPARAPASSSVHATWRPHHHCPPTHTAPHQTFQHEAILSLYCSFVQDTQLWFVMPYMEVSAWAEGLPPWHVHTVCEHVPGCRGGRSQGRHGGWQCAMPHAGSRLPPASPRVMLAPHGVPAGCGARARARARAPTPTHTHTHPHPRARARPPPPVSHR